MRLHMRPKLHLCPPPCSSASAHLGARRGAPGATSDITIVADQPSQGTNDLGTEGKSDVEKPGALSAPNKDDDNASGGAMTEPSMPDQSGAAKSDAAPGKGAAAQPGSDKGDNM